MRKTSFEGLKIIRHFEGFSASPYLCPGGYHTIGYGHVIQSYEQYDSITQPEAEALLVKDLTIAENAVLKLINIPLTDHQFDALVSFTFNLGAGALQRSALRRKVNASLHVEVPQEFMRWVYAGGRKLKGLVLRRKAESELYMREPS